MNSVVMVGPPKGFPQSHFELNSYVTLSWCPPSVPIALSPPPPPPPHPTFVFISQPTGPSAVAAASIPSPAPFVMQHGRQRLPMWRNAARSPRKRATSWWDREGDEREAVSNPWMTAAMTPTTSGAEAKLEETEWPGINQPQKKKVEVSDKVELLVKEESGVKVSNEPGILRLPQNTPVSYSQALKAAVPSPSQSSTEPRETASMEKNTKEEEERDNGKKANKKPVKRSRQGISLDLGGIYEQLEQIEHHHQQQRKEPTRKVALGGITAAINPLAAAKPAVQHKEGAAPRNPLDATAPVARRGKEREIPKVKKPSALKKIILKEREEKRKAREISESAQQMKARRLHGKRFRDYCDQILDKRVDEVVVDLLQKLVQFQDRQYHKDPQKAKSKRRIVLGLREVSKHLKVGKLKCVVVTPNLESISSAGGIDEMLQKIRSMCFEQDVPIVFALTRKGLGKAVNKKVPVSIVGVFNYDGANEQFDHVIELTHEARSAYGKLVAEFEMESKRLEEGQGSSTSSSRKTSQSESEYSDVSRKTSSQSEGDPAHALSINAQEFFPMVASGAPPPFSSPSMVSPPSYAAYQQPFILPHPMYVTPGHFPPPAHPHFGSYGLPYASPPHMFQPIEVMQSVVSPTLVEVSSPDIKTDYGTALTANQD
eukprot:m.26535 g.26535  ORF g.26535 m.26535 type:complete len:656 (+) comp29401_c0_seq2:330-2297(+)